MTAVLLATIIFAVLYVSYDIARLSSACLAVYLSGVVQPSADDGGQLTEGMET